MVGVSRYHNGFYRNCGDVMIAGLMMVRPCSYQEEDISRQLECLSEGVME